MRIEKIVNRQMDVNTYLVIKNQFCLIIDPSFSDQAIIEFIQKEELKPLGVILTHAHFDHLASANTICLLYNIPLYVHQKEVDFLYDVTKNLSSHFYRTKGYTIDQKVLVKTISEETKDVQLIPLNILHVPGHSPGSIALYFKPINSLISGDSLFYRSIGRTDFYGGDTEKLQKSIRTKLWKLPDETIVYPGHGPHTTIGYEKQNNPYIA